MLAPAVQTEIFEAAPNSTGIAIPHWVPKFSANAMANIIVQNARLPQPEVVMALDALGINFVNKFAPGLMDLALGWTVPFIEGARRVSQNTGANQSAGNLYEAAEAREK